MNLLLPLLLVVAADTGGVSTSRTVTIYAESGINCDSAQPIHDQWLSADKFRHAAMSFVITTGLAGGARTIADRDDSLLIGAAMGALAGMAKEIYDQDASTRDLIWDAAGIAAAVLMSRQAR